MLRATLLALALATTVSAEVKITRTAYAGWPNCYRITNGDVEIVVTSDVGPRILRYGFIGGQNLFKEFADQLGKSGETSWQPRGGHRIWIGPELVPDTYALDNRPVKVEIQGAVLEATQPVESETGVQKQIIVKLADKGSNVELVHRIRNTAQKPRRMAPWALTMMAPGGLGITGFPPRGKHPEVLPPTNPLVMWAYTDLSDKRWLFTKKYMLLKQDPKATTPQKLGHFNQHTFGAYLLGSDLFVKRYEADSTKTYADFGCSYETFTNADFLELETLGPLESAAPGATLQHVERWSLHKSVRLSSFTDAELDRVLLPVLR